MGRMRREREDNAKWQKGISNQLKLTITVATGNNTGPTMDP